MLHLLGRDPICHYGQNKGKRSAFDPRHLRFANYYRPKLYTPPAERRWDKAIKVWGVGGNNRYGNCVIVTPAHEILCWRANELGDTTAITDSAIIDLSRRMHALNGYNILDRLNYWRQKGMWGDNLWAYAAVTPKQSEEVAAAVDMFGALDIGLDLPTAWQDANVWDIGTGLGYTPGSWGGHSVPICGYDASYLYLVTWGAIKPMTWRALPVFCDEAYALIDSNWLAKNGETPNGFDLPTLKADLKAMKAWDGYATQTSSRPV